MCIYNIYIFFILLTFYIFIAESFSKKEYFTGAIEKLESMPSALEIIGAPPLKIHTLRLLNKYNHVDKSTAQVCPIQ